MGRKVREAGMDWVPYVVVVSDDEIAFKKLTVMVRKKSQPRLISFIFCSSWERVKRR